MKLVGTLILVAASLAAASPCAAALRLTPGLTGIRFVEVTGVGVSHSFGNNSAQMLNQLPGTLGSANQDFNGLSFEHYDVFYSDAAGVFDADGDYISIECRFESTAGGGGHNIDEAYLVFSDGTERCACAVASAVYLGPNSVAGSAANAADCTTGNNSTMGSTTGTQRLRITLDYACVVPVAPSTWGKIKLLYR